MSDEMLEENMRVIKEEMQRSILGAPTLPTVPNQPKTPLRNFRIPEDEYRPAFEKAQSEGTNLTAVVREKLREYVSEDGDE